MTKMRVKIDGFIYHNRQLKVVHPDEPNRFITAHVQDPIFENTPNVYTEAAIRQGTLDVTAKATLKDGRIQKLYIMDAQYVDG